VDATSVYAVPVLDRWLVHAPLHSLTALVNAQALRALRATGREELPLAVAELAAELARPPRPEPRPAEGPPRPDFLGLIPTRTCNLSCVYCAFGAPSAPPESMPVKTAVAAVDWMADRALEAGRSTLDVHFFGGEAFCEPDVVDVSVHRARARGAELGLTPRFEVSTNGCLDDARCRFVADHFYWVVLSIDGPPDLQDAHRPFRSGAGSYERAAQTARVLSRSRVGLSLRVTVTRSSTGRLPEITSWLCGELRPDSIVFEPLRPTPESVAAGLLPPDPWSFVPACLEAFRVARGLGVEPVFSAASIGELRHSFCPVGRDTAIVAPDGRIAACYMQESDWRAYGLDLTFGRISAEGEVTISQPALERMRALPRHGARCTHCLARWHCAGGCHVSPAAAERSRPESGFCVAARLITVCELLVHLGQAEEARRLLQDRAALAGLALRGSDRIADWEEGSA
jgi:uncharacterized protein